MNKAKVGEHITFKKYGTFPLRVDMLTDEVMAVNEFTDGSVEYITRKGYVVPEGRIVQVYARP